MIKTVCPPDCPKRSVTCRTSCPDWAAHEAAKEARYARRLKRREYDNYKTDTIRRSNKRKRDRK